MRRAIAPVVFVLTMMLFAAAGDSQAQSDADSHWGGSPTNSGESISFRLDRANGVIYDVRGLISADSEGGQCSGIYGLSTYRIQGNIPVALDGRFSYQGPWVDEHPLSGFTPGNADINGQIQADNTAPLTVNLTGTVTSNGTCATSASYSLTANCSDCVTPPVDAPDCTITGTAGNDSIEGTAGNDTICGLGGDDGINGGGGADVLRGGPGRDRILGGSGNDTLKGETGPDSLMGGEGADTLDGGSDRNIFRGGAGNDEMVGGRDFDTLIYLSAPRKMKVNLATGKATGEGTDSVSGMEAVVGSRHDDVLKGSPRFNQLDGNAGSDTVSGLGGSDLLSGGAGPDDLLGGAGEDLLVGGGGRNALNGGGQADTCYSAHGGPISSCERKGNDADL